MGFDVSLFSAFVAGLISFMSPCVLPIVPPYLCYMAGVGVAEVRGEAEGSNHPRGVNRRLLATAVVFVLGFSSVFVALGATASTIGQLVSAHLDTLSIIAGVLITAMGLHFLGIIRIGALMRDVRIDVKSKPGGLLSAYIMGLAFAFGWTPCVGPILATILFVAGTEDTALKGAGLLLVYALGIGIPFILVALFIGPVMRSMSKLGGMMGNVERVMGVFLVIAGILFMTGMMSEIAFWLLETFPSLGQVG